MAVFGGLHSARWLKAFQQAPMVTAFRNLESGQVLFTQTLHPQQFYINQQFKWPNWQNKKPTDRKDIWRPLAVAEMPSHKEAVRLYRNLVLLRQRRDMYERDQAQAWRKKSAEGNIWFANQYRPTYTFEAVADLVSAIEEVQTSQGEQSTPSEAIIHWDSEFRKGDEKHWEGLKIDHQLLPRHNPREQFAVLNRVRQAALDRLYSTPINEDEASAEAVKEQAELEKIVDRQRRIYEGRVREHQKLLEQRPDLVQLAERGEMVRRAARDLKEAKAAFDPYTPRGQRGAAKLPIKLREKTLRQAKRQFRALKHRIATRNKKRRVPQPRSRMRL